MKSLSSKTYQCGVTIQGLTTLAGTTYLTGITNTTSWEHVIVGTTAQPKDRFTLELTLSL